VPLVALEATVHRVARAPAVIIQRIYVIRSSAIGKELDPTTAVLATLDKFAMINHAAVTIHTLAMKSAV
jgi:hypothetical protein